MIGFFLGVGRMHYLYKSGVEMVKRIIFLLKSRPYLSNVSKNRHSYPTAKYLSETPTNFELRRCNVEYQAVQGNIRTFSITERT